MSEPGSNALSVGDLTEIERNILAYLDEHPMARDTWEGIVEWWLLEREIRRQGRKVQQALDRLVEEELLVASEGPDRRLHYRVNPERREEVRLLTEGVSS